MSRQHFGVGSNKWIMVASDEVWQIQKRWRLLSFRQLSACLYIDRRTLSKLDYHHPDGTLTLEMLDRIYATFIHLCPEYFPQEEVEEERRRLIDSRIRILMCSEVSPQVLAQK
ncbi:hypothetical protein [uncultured Parabacteroides sp.]|uniref:hypothetical protein n=1 Tax=uncultured Parabacteroides sp. TaxID=512312 RepID=UPI00259B9C8C|nr:hypothetical protein [uncultured Parabacteroides sp.]